MHRSTLALVTGALVLVSAGAVTARLQAPQKQNSYHEASQRGNTRIFYWGPKGTEPTGGSIGQLAIDHGQPVWKDAYDAAVEQKRDHRWRFGQNFWTTLDTNIDLAISDVDVPAGYYYLALEHTSDDRWLLWAIDPKEAYEKKLDAYHAHFTTGGIEIPLEYEKVEEKAPKLTVTLRRRPTERDLATFEVRFGPHRLVTDVEMKPEGEDS